MKKLFVVLIFATAFQSCCIFFPHIPCEKTLNISAGPGEAILTGDKSQKPILGGLISIEPTVYGLNTNASISAGLGVSFQGSRYIERRYSGKLKMSYINMPLLFNYESNHGFYGEIGIQPGFLLSARDRIVNRPSHSFRNYVKKIELAVPVGAGYWLTDDISLGIRTTYGLTNMQNWGGDVKKHNILITGLVRYRINWENQE